MPPALRPSDLHAETAPATGLAATPGDYGFPPGTRVGRYVLRERLGAGGMGVVYSADDSKLGRSVALKLLRPDASGNGDAQKQLLREAQTLARLAHPNVVNVHDIGEFDGRVYVDMELVKGKNLGQWLAARDRPLQEMLDVFIQAGRGLAAAHALGIVHRDFKPDNVLVGDDGRVRVADFGIALLGPQPLRDGATRENEEPMPGATPEDGLATAPPVTHSQARSASRTGTPRYMAPEQRRDGTADARSDQYSYCVTLREAVHGEGRKPPAWLEQALDRGLSPAPEDRHASMEALLGMLESEPKRRRRIARLAATAVAAVALLAAGAVWGNVRHATPAPLCRGSEAKLAGVWDQGRKGEIAGAFRATDKPFAADAWRGAQGTLDAYARDWVALRTEACEATRFRGEQSDQLLGLRMTCLDERFAAMAALSDVLAHADDGVVAHALSAAKALPRLSSCSDAKGLLARVKPPADPETAARVAGLETRLARAKALDDAGKYAEALTLARAIVLEAQETSDRGVQALAFYMEGSLLGRTSDLLAAEQALRRAASAADAAGDDATRVRAWGALLFYVAGEGAKFALIPSLREQGAAALVRLGEDGDVEANFLEDLGAAYLAAGKLDDAREADEKAALVEARTYGKDSWQEGIALQNLGTAYATAGKTAKAIEVEQRALAIDEAQLGSAHPFVAAAENTIAGALDQEGQHALAEEHARRAVQIGDGTIGEEELSRFLFDLGEVLVAEGKLEEALGPYGRALAMETKIHPGEDLVLWNFLKAMGETYLALGKPLLAAPYLERALGLTGAGAQEDALEVSSALARAKARGARER